METTEILEKIYNLSTESKLADERIEIHFAQINKRIETLETLSQNMAENLNDFKHIQSIIDQLTNIVHQNTDDISEIKKKLTEIELAPQKESAKKWNYVVDSIFKALIGAIGGFLTFKYGLTFEN